MIVPGASPSQQVREIAVFDLDGTLTRRSTLAPFLMQSVPRPRLLRALMRTAPHLLAISTGAGSRQRAKEALLSACFRGEDQAAVERLAVRFAEDTMPALLRPEAMQRVEAHSRRGHLVVVATASLELYVTAWALAAGFDAVVGTRLEVSAGRLTGRISGSNCRGSEKVRRLTELLGDLTARTIHAYGDSAGDRAMLAAATYAHYREF